MDEKIADITEYGPSDGFDTTKPIYHARSTGADIEAQNSPQLLQPEKPHIQILDTTQAPDADPGSQAINRTGTGMTSRSLRKRGRADTNMPYGATEMGRTSGWCPGEEPGIDTNDPSPPYSRGSTIGPDHTNPHKLDQRCEITVVDYSSEDMDMHYLDNDNLEEFLQRPSPESAQVRWINVNGLSWDVIRMLGNEKGLHRLAIEDLINTRNRTKADWYNDHTFLVLSLQKLINLREGDDSGKITLRRAISHSPERYLVSSIFTNDTVC